MSAPRTSAPSTTTGTDALLYLLLAAAGAALVFTGLAWLSGNLTNTLAGTGAWAHFQLTALLLHPGALWPRLSPTTVTVTARVVPGLLCAALVTVAAVTWLRLRGGPSGLARRSDLKPLVGREVAVRAQDLRPGLTGRRWKRGRG